MKFVGVRANEDKEVSNLLSIPIFLSRHEIDGKVSYKRIEALKNGQIMKRELLDENNQEYDLIKKTWEKYL
jgi:hypothetical protein